MSSDQDRSYESFLRATWEQPGIVPRIAAAGVLLLGVFLRSGVRHGLLVLAIGAGLLAGPGYVAWRRWGKRPRL